MTDVSSKTKSIQFDELNKEILEQLSDLKRDFWYRLGSVVAGPLYLGLYNWLEKKTENNSKNIWILAENDNRLFRTFVENGYKGVRCLDPAHLNHCNGKGEFERLRSIGFFECESIVFDPAMEGAFQYELENLKREFGIKIKHEYCYLGIMNSETARKNIHKLHYDTYLFDFYRNQSIQRELLSNQCIIGLLFSSSSSFRANDADGSEYYVGISEKDKQSIEMGCSDYLNSGVNLLVEQKLILPPADSVTELRRLLSHPTGEEAKMIGDLEYFKITDSGKNERWHIASPGDKKWEDEIKGISFWWAGFFSRQDIPESRKETFADHFKVRNPKEKYDLEDEQSIRNYQRWIRYNENHRETPGMLEYYPRFSVVIPVYNTPTEQLEECISSVLAQRYDNYRLILIDDHSSWENVVPVLKKYEENEKVLVIYRDTNGNISAAANDGIENADGEFIVFMDCYDVIDPDALYEFANKLNENRELDFIYSDEDRITEDGKIRHKPFFKPDWSPDLFLNMMYTNHLAAYRSSIVKELGGMRTGYEGSRDYDLVLRMMERSDDSRIGHVPKVLYHKRERRESTEYEITSKNNAVKAAALAKEDYIRRTGIKAHLELDNEISQYRFVYEIVGEPLVSIIIPSKDHPEILRQCIDSIEDYTEYRNYEIIVLDNGSGEENRRQIADYLEKRNAKYIYHKEPFNYSKMCNKGAGCSNGEYLLFVNDDVEFFQADWLSRMLGQAQQEKTGAVGAKLYYPETTIIQHAGVANLFEGPSHNFVKLDDSNVYYFGWNRVDYDCIAVTGACLMVKTSKFREIGGFDTSVAVAYNDVKLCFALHKRGYRNIIRNDVVAYHYESLSRGDDSLDDEKLIRSSRERVKTYSDFPELQGRDPYLNENLHNYTNGLDLKMFYDETIPIDLSGAKPAEAANIDAINIGDRVQILGWSVLENEDHIEELDRYIVFEDPYGETLAAKVLSMCRLDLAESLSDIKYKYGGFETVCRLEELRFDMMRYHIGVLTIGRDGNKYLKWCQDSNIVRRGKPRPFARPSKWVSDTFERHLNNDLVWWYIYECKYYKDDSYHIIRGSAFKNSRDHYKYQKSLVLDDERGNAIEFEVQLEQRIDVAFTFPDHHFLYYTGFLCYVFDDVLWKGTKYKVLIRLKNVFDEQDVLDVDTGLFVEN